MSDDQAGSCSLSRAMVLVGDRWTMLIVREALAGVSRYTQFQRALAIPTDTLAARLATLTDAGILERVAVNDAGTRMRYDLTPAGRELGLALVPLQRWAQRHLPSDAEQVDFFDAAGGRVEGVLTDSAGRRIEGSEVRFARV